jgi:hypothetical protein
VPKKLKKTCCHKYRHKGKACNSCPLMARLSKRERKDFLRRHRKTKSK